MAVVGLGCATPTRHSPLLGIRVGESAGKKTALVESRATTATIVYS